MIVLRQQTTVIQSIGENRVSKFTVLLYSGKVEGKIKKLDGNCGIALLYDVYFEIFYGKTLNSYKEATKKREKLYEEFYKWLLAHNATLLERDHFGRAIFMMTDKEGGQIDKFCRYKNRWNSMDYVHNHRSNNKINIYTLNAKELNKKKSV